MSEITIGTKASNDVLLWNGSAWVNSGILGSTYAPLLDPTFTSNVEIQRGLVINKGRVAQKHYSYSGTLTSFSNVGISSIAMFSTAESPPNSCTNTTT